MIIVLKDQGIGIPQEDQEKIFNLFERGISHEVIRGLGLGFFITKEIVLVHGGRIWVESKQSHGSTFFIETTSNASNSL